MNEKIIKAVGDMKSVSFAIYHKNVKDFEKAVLSGTPLFLHKEKESKKGIIMVDFDEFLFLMHCYLNYVQEQKEKSLTIPAATS